MKKTISTEKVLAAYKVLSSAKYGKLDDADKIKAWKIARALKPTATKFEDDSKDAAEKLKPGDDFDDRLQKAREFEVLSRTPNADMEKAPMGAAEYNDFISDFQKFNKNVADALKEFADAKVEVEFEPLTEDAFIKLMNSNDWNVEQAMILGDLITE